MKNCLLKLWDKVTTPMSYDVTTGFFTVLMMLLSGIGTFAVCQLDLTVSLSTNVLLVFIVSILTGTVTAMGCDLLVIPSKEVLKQKEVREDVYFSDGDFSHTNIFLTDDEDATYLLRSSEAPHSEILLRAAQGPTICQQDTLLRASQSKEMSTQTIASKYLQTAQTESTVQVSA